MHNIFMQEALKEAQKAYAANEVPIGCVVVRGEGEDAEIIGRGYNLRNTRGNVLAHAEIIAINEACRAVGDWRLEGCRIYITIEPCPMCAGAILQARIPIAIYGAANPKAGCAGSILNILDDARFNHRAEVIAGVEEEACAGLMRGFFAGRRGC